MSQPQLPKTQQEVSKYFNYKMWAVITVAILGAMIIPSSFIMWLAVAATIIGLTWGIAYLNISNMKTGLGKPTKEEWKAYVTSLPADQKELDHRIHLAKKQEYEKELAAYWAQMFEILDMPQYELMPTSTRPNLDVVGEAYREENVIRALGGLRPNEEQEVYATAHLIPETNNPHDKNAIAVWMNKEHVGYLAREDAAVVQPTLLQIYNQGYLPSTPGRIWGVTRYSASTDSGVKHHLYARVALEPSQVRVPTNNPPTDPYSLLPWGAAIQVSKEADYLPELTEHLTGKDNYVIATLQKQTRTLKNGTERVYLSVHIDGEQVGELTPATSAKMIPTIDFLSDQDLTTAVWARVKGTQLAIEMTLHAAKSHEIEQDWIENVPHTIPAFRMGKTNTTLNGLINQS